MGGHLACPSRQRPQKAPVEESRSESPDKEVTSTDLKQLLSKVDAEVLENAAQQDLTDEDRRELESMAPNGHWDGNAYVIDPAPDDEDGHGTIVIFNAEKGYGLIRPSSSTSSSELPEEGDAFFTSSAFMGEPEERAQLVKGREVSYKEDTEMIEGQLCAYEVRLINSSGKQGVDSD